MNSFSSYFDFSLVDWSKVASATKETLFMTVISTICVTIFGLLLGLLLFETKNNQSLWSKILYWVVAAFVNIFRSIPFIILIVLLFPVTKLIVGKLMGPVAALPTLIISASPFYARMVELAFREIDHGVIEAAEAMGASKFQIITKVLLRESLPALVSGLTVTAISMVGYTAMAGIIGAGGLGNMAYLEGWQRNQNSVTMVATIAILIIVVAIQWLGDFSVKRIDKR